MNLGLSVWTDSQLLRKIDAMTCKKSKSWIWCDVCENKICFPFGTSYVLNPQSENQSPFTTSNG